MKILTMFVFHIDDAKNKVVFRIWNCKAITKDQQRDNNTFWCGIRKALKGKRKGSTREIDIVYKKNIFIFYLF